MLALAAVSCNFRFEEMDLSGKHSMFLLEFHENVSLARGWRFEVMDLSGKQSMFLLEFDENLSALNHGK
ncbi:hypothetical protein EJB05_21711 [Eragrostis curvula]|uniref:Uncharacterized protein n=1 Tax=Eragrostis curvula TaxID=38414 RepID=A0A5J9V3J8_9POAL|nr:hypothetical protein EJB05_21711 [Eragrostis curvula]